MVVTEVKTWATHIHMQDYLCLLWHKFSEVCLQILKYYICHKFIVKNSLG